jgi:hypothetical protein
MNGRPAGLNGYPDIDGSDCSSFRRRRYGHASAPREVRTKTHQCARFERTEGSVALRRNAHADLNAPLHGAALGKEVRLLQCPRSLRHRTRVQFWVRWMGMGRLTMISPIDLAFAPEPAPHIRLTRDNTPGCWCYGAASRTSWGWSRLRTIIEIRASTAHPPPERDTTATWHSHRSNEADRCPNAAHYCGTSRPTRPWEAAPEVPGPPGASTVERTAYGYSHLADPSVAAPLTATRFEASLTLPSAGRTAGGSGTRDPFATQSHQRTRK